MMSSSGLELGGIDPESQMSKAPRRNDTVEI